MPAPMLPPIQRQVQPPTPADPSDISNPFERVAALVVQSAQDMATRLAQNMAEVPADSHELSPDELKQMWFYSPAGNPTQADELFWQTHDRVLANTGDPNQAETQALEAAYPYRSQIAAVGDANAERQVQLAEQARRVVDGDQAPNSEEVTSALNSHQMAIRHSNGYIS